MGNTEISISLNEHRMAALDKVMQDHGSSVEEHLQNYLIDLYSEMVPHEEQKRVKSLIAEERKQTAIENELHRRFSAIHITESGAEDYILYNEPNGMYRMASLLDAYLHEAHLGVDSFTDSLQNWERVTAEQFDLYIKECIDRSKRVVNVFDINLDKGEFSRLYISDGWKNFGLKDLCAAAAKALREAPHSHSNQVGLFDEYIKGIGSTSTPMQMLQGTRRLQPTEVSFEDEILISDGRVNFYVPLAFGVREVFGLDPGEGDTVNVYADYDLLRRRAFNTLDVTFQSDDAYSTHRYLLTEEERTVLENKMEDYYQRQCGESLRDIPLELQQRPSSPEMAQM